MRKSLGVDNKLFFGEALDVNQLEHRAFSVSKNGARSHSPDITCHFASRLCTVNGEITFRGFSEDSSFGWWLKDRWFLWNLGRLRPYGLGGSFTSKLGFPSGCPRPAAKGGVLFHAKDE